MDWAERYKTPIADVFSRAHKLSLEHRVELALLQALGDLGKIPKEAHEELQETVRSGKVTLSRTLEIEHETHHDIMAMVKALSEQSAAHGGWVHFGATSQDINDTVLALQLGDAREVLLATLRGVRGQLTALARRHRDLACIGRTHGQHAIPVTMGFKFANFLYEIATAESFLRRATLFGKFGGATGTFAALGGDDSVMRRVMEILEVTPAPITTQVVSRLHLCDFAFGVVSVACALERLAKELRHLQRSEIGETVEGFGAKQVGSSTMPQKRNPHKSERVCGIARLVRAQLAPLLETVALEHERDLTNSSVERVALPSALGLAHFAAREMENVLKGLTVDVARVDENLRRGGGKQLAERVMMALAASLGRQRAHELLRTLTAAPDFGKAIHEHEEITAALSHSEIDALLDPTTYVGRAPAIVDEITAAYGVELDAEATESGRESQAEKTTPPKTDEEAAAGGGGSGEGDEA